MATLSEIISYSGDFYDYMNSVYDSESDLYEDIKQSIKNLGASEEDSSSSAEIVSLALAGVLTGDKAITVAKLLSNSMSTAGIALGTQQANNYKAVTQLITDKIVQGYTYSAAEEAAVSFQKVSAGITDEQILNKIKYYKGAIVAVTAAFAIWEISNSDNPASETLKQSVLAATTLIGTNVLAGALVAMSFPVVLAAVAAELSICIEDYFTGSGRAIEYLKFADNNWAEARVLRGEI